MSWDSFQTEKKCTCDYCGKEGYFSGQVGWVTDTDNHRTDWTVLFEDSNLGYDNKHICGSCKCLYPKAYKEFKVQEYY